MSVDDQDNTLLIRIANGDKVAFGELLDRYLKPVIAFTRRYTTNYADADDIAQETFTQVWLKAADWQDQGTTALGWIYRIAYNRCIDLMRRTRRMVLVDEVEISQTGDDPADQLADMASVTHIETCLKLLPERQYTAIVLSAITGLSNKEAAGVMGLSVEALESLLARGRKRLKELLLLNVKEEKVV